MATMIEFNGRLLRISPKDSTILEYSTTKGQSWHRLYKTNSTQGNFLEIMESGKELLARCEKGLFYSTTGGQSWHFRSK